MDSQNPEALDERAMAETPEDVAVLYSWANLQGAKYRDFSASRREYRAQMRHRAAEQQREEEMRAKNEAEEAAAEAERAAREAEEAARFHESASKRASAEQHGEESQMEEEARARAMRHAAELNRRAASERVEAARRAEAVAAAEAAARREAREMAEAQASAARQAARYAESEYMRRSLAGPQPTAAVPGQISDPYTDDQPVVLPGHLFHRPHAQAASEDDMQPTRLPRTREARLLVPQPDPAHPSQGHGAKEFWVTGPIEEEAKIAAGGTTAIEGAAAKPHSPVYYYEPDSQEKTAAVEHYAHAAPYAGPTHVPARAPKPGSGRHEAVLRPIHESPVHEEDRSREGQGRDSKSHESQARESQIHEQQVNERQGSSAEAQRSGAHATAAPMEPSRYYEPARTPPPQPSVVYESAREPVSGREPAREPMRKAAREPLRSAEAIAQPVAQTGSGPRRARGYQPDESSGVYQAHSGSPFAGEPIVSMRNVLEGNMPEGNMPEGNVPEWIHSPQDTQRSTISRRLPAASPVVDTLQHSRERVAARWYALKGIFEHSQPEPPTEAAVGRQKDTRVPMLTLFSLAGGVGKTSLVATLGRALSATGEKVLLTDTTSHGLLPFYFGASELRPGAVRTFSPPAGSSDAPIALVSYDVAQNSGDTVSQEWLAEELIRNSRGIQRVILDLSPVSPWVIRRLVRMNSVVVVPVAPDMNSVISLGPMEKFFGGMMDGDGRPVQPFYLLNQFDASLPLHLDVREVMRQQLGDRLLPFVIRRSPSVSEALAEGMTVMDYAPDAPVASDYMNFAAWLRMQSAPAASGFKNARWSER